MSHAPINRKTPFLLTVVSILLINNPIFSNSQGMDIIPVPIYINELYAGELSVTILPDESVQIRPSELIAYLKELMTDEAIQTAEKIFPESGWLDLTQMAGLGVRILFRFEDLTIHITIPPHLSKETIVSLTSPGKQPVGTEVYQTDFSAFMNLSLWNRFTYETLTYDFSATPELGLNIFSWVLEAKGGVQTTGDLFFLDYARIVKDFPSIAYRLEVGDLTIPITDLSGVSTILGASFRRNTQLLDDSAVSGAYEKEIFLREASKVEIYINDRKIREANYPSGSYIFKDFQLSRGINRIIIKWDDSEGAHEEELIVPYQSSMLNAGEMDLGGAAGLPDREIVLPVITSYQYIGITENFTFGITESFSFDQMELFISPDFLLSTGFGSFNLLPLWGMNFTGGQMLDISLGYQMLNPGLENYLNFGGSLGYSYDSISSEDSTPSTVEADGYFNFIFGDGFSITPEAYWGYRLDEERHIIRAKAILKKSIRGGSALTANIGFTYDEEPAFSATISYSSSFPDLNQNLYILENLETQKLSAFWNKYATEDESLSYNASTEIPMTLDEKISLGAQAGYDHPLFSLSASHDLDAIINSGDINNSTSLSASSGIVYADGHLLLTKPINDSFIIIAPEDDFAKQTILVNPYSGGSDLELLGNSGVLSAVNSFTTHKVYIEAEELIPGMDDSGLKYLAKPMYKSGIVIVPQAETLIFIGGFLLNAEKHPVEAAFGSLTGKTTEESVDFFTDENGYFEAYNLVSDTYILQLAGQKDIIEIDLRDVKSGFHDAGNLTIGEK